MLPLALLALGAVSAALGASPEVKLVLPAGIDSNGTGNGTAAASGVQWALLIAGSAGWGNYRHQADVAHAYQVLRRGGLRDSHIVVMMQDDLASSFFNPHPGKLFNKPKGPDVYKGVPKDYTGEQVTTTNFLKVLEGKKIAKGPGASGKVIKSGPDDKVFVYYADHGAPGILGMPNGPFLYADQLLGALRRKRAAKGFRELVLYVEACESGSMFQGLLKKDLGVYALTAANSVESSWGTYCPGMSPSAPEFNTCLGDLFSVSFLEDSDANDLTKETLEKQYERVKLRTSNKNTYNMGSHVLQFGALAIDAEPVSHFLGGLNRGRRPGENDASPLPELIDGGMAINQRAADLVPLWVAVRNASTPQQLAAANDNLLRALEARAALDASIRAAIAALLANPKVVTSVQAAFPAANLLLPTAAQLAAAEAAGNAAPAVPPATIEALAGGPLPRGPDAPVVDDWDCLRAMVSQWEQHCGPLDSYGQKYTGALANLCNSKVDPKFLGPAIAPACANGFPDPVIITRAQPVLNVQ